MCKLSPKVKGIPPALFGATLLVERGLRLVHVEPVKAVHASAGVDAVEDGGGHADNLEIVL
jgi:hypothetical protein